MTIQKKVFIEDSDRIAFNLKHRSTVKFNISKYDFAVHKGMVNYVDIEQAKKRASNVKQGVVDNLPEYLLQFEKNFIARGGVVLWAETAADVIKAVQSILIENSSELLVKSKSMTTEEIDFNEHMESIGVESLETDLGEYIVQLAGEKPYHIVTPAMHKSKEDISMLFNQKFEIPDYSTPEFITAYVRKILRNKFMQADVGVTGSNFLIADIGAIALTENEGNAMMSFSFPKIHIAISGIEKLVPKMVNLGLFWPLLAVHGTGQQATVYNSIICGPRGIEEVDGPDKMYVILLDNGRSELYRHSDQHIALKCIRCGACLNACPIYKNIGGYTYASTYSGPIGSVITPFFKGFKLYNHLSYACSVCGRCSDVCPVKLPLHKLMLYNRRDAVDRKYGTKLWDFGMKAYAFAFGKRSRLDLIDGRVKNGLGLLCRNALGKRKQIPTFATRSFSKQWRSTNKGNAVYYK